MDNIPIIAVVISLTGLMLTLVKMYREQVKYHQLRYEQDRRLEYKLRIHDILLSESMNYNDMCTKFQSQSPMTIVDPLQLRKCIYEMLIEKTIVALDDGLYAVNSATEED